MEIWLDTTDVSTIEKANQMGILYGVTTNPSIVSKYERNLDDLLARLLSCQKGPVTVQVTAQNYEKMLEQARALFAYSNRIIIKIPATGEGLRAVHALSTLKIPTMVTAVFDLNQVLLSARAKATYIAPYFSKICEEDQNGIEALRSMLRLLHRYNESSKLIAASIRSPEQVKECSEIGVHAVTVNEKVFSDLTADHPMTLESVNRFTKDWKKAKKNTLLQI